MIRRFSRLNGVLLLAGLGVATLGFSTATAGAITTTALRPVRTGGYAAMTVTGFNPTVAQAHGYRIVTLSDGTRASIKETTYRSLGRTPSDSAVRSAATTTYNSATGVVGGSDNARVRSTAPSAQSTPSGTVRPQNYVYGDCGDSYYFLGASDADWSSLTGYDVRDSVADFSWHTEFRDPDDSVIEGKDYGEEATGPSWEGDDGSPPYLTLDGSSDGVIWYGTWSGFVASGEATLVDGTTCISGDPGDVADNG